MLPIRLLACGCAAAAVLLAAAPASASPTGGLSPQQPAQASPDYGRTGSAGPGMALPRPRPRPQPPGPTGTWRFAPRWPVPGRTVTSPFGMRWGRMHTGADLAASTGTPVTAAASGTAAYAGRASGYGNLVIVSHTHGYSTYYAHLSRIAVAEGDPVARGQLLAWSGCTGHCLGPHLHFEIRIGDAPHDPLAWLPR